MYPIITEGAVLLTDYESYGTVTPFAIQIRDRVYELSEAEYRAMQKADGLHPLELACFRPSRSLRYLRKIGAIQTRRLVRRGLFQTFTLFPIGPRADAWVRTAGVCNHLLPAFSLLMFAFGLLSACVMPLQLASGNGFQDFWIDKSALLVVLHTIAAAGLHECGHLAAAVACGFPVRDTGVLLLGLFPIGAYVSCAVTDHAPSRRKLQMYLAGCEVNLLLTGLWLACAHLIPGFGLVGAAGALINGMICALNMLPAHGLDGAHALAILLGTEDVTSYAYAQLFIPAERTVRHRAALVGCALILLSNVVVWGLNIYGLVAMLLP